MVADDVAAAQRREADAAGAALAVAVVDGAALERLALRARRRPRPSRSAVPLGASTFMRWCVSTISTSKPSASERAATSSSFSTTLTPTLMFGAMTIAMCSAWRRDLAPSARRRSRSCRSTAATPSSRQRARWASVPSGRVKSISTSLAASAARASAPTTTPLGAAEEGGGVAADGGRCRRRRSAAASTRSALATTASISVLAHAARGAGDRRRARRRRAGAVMSAARAAGRCAPAPAAPARAAAGAPAPAGP